MTLPLTPSQTVGPFFSIGLTWDDGPYVVPEGTPGAIWISGRVFDGAGEPVPDAMLETWQADPSGEFPSITKPDGSPAPAQFRGFGRCATDVEGGFALLTVKPASLPAGDGALEAPHVDVTVFARGLLYQLSTRIYFPDEVDANAADPVLRSLPEPIRSTLIARRDAHGLRFDIHLQGDDETVFFDL